MTPEETAASSATTHRRRWFILVVLCMSVLLVAMDNTIVNVALPTLDRQFATTTSDLQWVVDIYTVFFAGLLLVFATSATGSAANGCCKSAWSCSAWPPSPRRTPRP